MERRAAPFVAALLIAAYVPFLGGGFLTDDFAHLERLRAADGLGATLASPDVFGFYRPVTQGSLKLQLLAGAASGAAFRVVNLALHACVIAAAFWVAALLADRRAAVLATAAFALTPKAAPIAVLWMSARGELLMALGASVAVAAWIVWSRGGRTAWLGVAAGGYVCAVLSKETAVLLPMLLLAAPAPARDRGSRLRAAGGLVLLLVALVIMRAHAGALMPFTPHEQYDVSTPAALWFRNLRNYAGRMAPVPIALLVLALLARLSPTSARGTLRQQLPLFAFALAWIAVFIAPVLPIAARSELYLYAPVFGACLAAGAIAASQWPRRTTTLWRVAVGILVVALAGYQMSRSLALHRDLQFSSRFVSALAGQPALRTWAGAVAVVPRDAVTERALRDAVGGYLPTVLRQLFPDPRLTGVVAYDGRPLPPNAVRLSCELRDGDVKLTWTPPHAARGSRDATK